MHISDINQEPPRIEFPCDYPIKVMGIATEAFQAEVLEIIHRHTSPVSEDRVTERPSARGNYISVTVVIEATGEDQLKAIFRELMDQESVKIVL